MSAIVFCILGTVLGGLMVWCALSRRVWAMITRSFIQNLPNQRGLLAAFGARVVLLTFGSMLILMAGVVMGLNLFDPDEHHPGVDLIIILAASFGPLIASPMIASIWQKHRD